MKKRRGSRKYKNQKRKGAQEKAFKEVRGERDGGGNCFYTLSAREGASLRLKKRKGRRQRRKAD